MIMLQTSYIPRLGVVMLIQLYHQELHNITVAKPSQISAEAAEPPEQALNIFVQRPDSYHNKRSLLYRCYAANMFSLNLCIDAQALVEENADAFQKATQFTGQ